MKANVINNLNAVTVSFFFNANSIFKRSFVFVNL